MSREREAFLRIADRFDACADHMTQGAALMREAVASPKVVRDTPDAGRIGMSFGEWSKKSEEAAKKLREEAAALRKWAK